MNELAVISPFFDYPENFLPPYYNKVVRDIGEEHVKMIRMSTDIESANLCREIYGLELKDQSYLFKLGFFKTIAIRQHILNLIKDKYKYLIFCDGTDVGYIDNIKTFNTIFEHYNSNLVIGCEVNLWPNNNITSGYDDKLNKKQKYLNSGFILSDVNEFITRLDNIRERKSIPHCDQESWHYEYLYNGGVELDHDNLLVFNTYAASDMFSITNKTVHFKTNTPIFVHDNGGSEENTVKLVPYFT